MRSHEVNTLRARSRASDWNLAAGVSIRLTGLKQRQRRRQFHRRRAADDVHQRRLAHRLAGDVANGTIFVGKPGTIETQRAITIWGVTGLLRHGNGAEDGDKDSA